MNASLFVGATFAAIEKDFENVYHARGPRVRSAWSVNRGTTLRFIKEFMNIVFATQTRGRVLALYDSM